MPGRRNILNSKTSGRMMDAGKPVVAKSRFKKILVRQFPHILRNSTVTPSEAPLSVTNPRPGEESSKAHNKNNDKNLIMVRTARDDLHSSGSDHEPSSMCLAQMVHDFMENGEKNPDCGRARCNCSYGHCKVDGDAGGNEEHKSAIGSGEVCDILKSLVPCQTLWERNVLADTSRFLEAASHEAKDGCTDNDECANELLRRSIMTRLRSLGYNAAICKSRWDQAPGFPTGEYEYIDVIVEGEAAMGSKPERIIVDIDFQSQFQIARSTAHYAGVLRMLPHIFVGKADRLQQIVSIVCEAAKQSLKNGGLHIPPWRKPDYMRAKWLSAYKRTTNEVTAAQTPAHSAHPFSSDVNRGEITSIAVKGSGWGSRFTSEFELEFRRSGLLRRPKEIKRRGGISQAIKDNNGDKRSVDDQITVVVTEWQPPAVKPKSGQRERGGKIAAGLASMLREAGISSKTH